MTRGFRKLNWINALIAVAISASAAASAGASLSKNVQVLQHIAEGVPPAENNIGPSSFVKFEAQRLAHPTLWYVDYQWHREHGVEVPKEGLLNEEFVKNILDAYAYQTRGEDDPAEAFTNGIKTLFADYYGGYGMSVNWGSGRAAASGLVQAKGLRTPLVQSTDPYHSNGAVQSIESVDEAIWSQILDTEMQFGSNKVVAVILTGTYGRMKDTGQVFPRALIIREMGVRPAHFMLNEARPVNDDHARIAETLPRLLKNLPYPAGYVASNNAEALRTGVFELIDREALTQAEYYAKRLYFGSVSPSNLEIKGRRLDLGDHTAQEGYTKIYRLDDDSPFGETEEFHKMFEDFRSSLAKTLPAPLLAALPTKEEFVHRFEVTFQKGRVLEMVKLTGAPAELIESMAKTSSLKNLGELLLDISKQGNDRAVFMEPAGYPNTSTYNIGAILKALADVDQPLSIEKFHAALAGHISHNDILSRRLAKYYFEFKNDLVKSAYREYISRDSLEHFMREAVVLRNKTRSELVRGDRRWHELWDVTGAAIESKDPLAVQKYINEQTAKAIINFKDAGPYRLVLHQTEDKEQGVTFRDVFDARTGTYQTVLRVSVAGGSGFFNDERLRSERLEQRKIETIDEQNHSKLTSGKRLGQYVEFEFQGSPVKTFAKLYQEHLRQRQTRAPIKPVVSHIAIRHADRGFMATVNKCVDRLSELLQQIY